MMMGELEREVPRSVWEKVREGLMPDLLLILLGAVVLALILDSRVLAFWALMAAGAWMPAFLLLLALEWRHDARWEREADRVARKGMKRNG
jgi:hypothetical protein